MCPGRNTSKTLSNNETNQCSALGKDLKSLRAPDRAPFSGLFIFTLVAVATKQREGSWDPSPCPSLSAVFPLVLTPEILPAVAEGETRSDSDPIQIKLVAKVLAWRDEGLTHWLLKFHALLHALSREHRYFTALQKTGTRSE